VTLRAPGQGREDSSILTGGSATGSGQRYRVENTVGVKVPLCGDKARAVVAVGICDLLVVIGPEQVLVSAGKRVRRKRGRHRVGSGAR
jgi:hypothetical protein